MADTIPVPQEIIAGEDVLIKIPVPALPVEFTVSGTKIYTLSFVNLDDNSVYPFPGEVKDDTIIFMFPSDSMTPGAYTWRLNYQGDDDPTYHDVDVFNGSITQPSGRPYTWVVPSPAIPVPEGQHWLFTIPGVEAGTLIETDRIRALNANTEGQFYDHMGGWNVGFIQIGLDGDRRRHGVGRKSDNELLYYVSFPGDYAVRIQRHTSVPGIIRKVLMRGYTVVVDDVEQKVHERTMIVLLEKILEDRLTNKSDMIGYSIGGRSMSREPISAIYFMLARYRQAYATKKRGGRPDYRLSYAETFGRGNGWR